MWTGSLDALTPLSVRSPRGRPQLAYSRQLLQLGGHVGQEKSRRAGAGTQPHWQYLGREGQG